jgi:hypothetical protein
MSTIRMEPGDFPRYMAMQEKARRLVSKETRPLPTLPPLRSGADFSIISGDAVWDELRDSELFALLTYEQKERVFHLGQAKQEKLLKAWRIIKELVFEPESDQRPIIRWLAKVLG